MSVALLIAASLVVQSSAAYVSVAHSRQAAPAGYGFLAAVATTRDPGFWATEIYSKLGTTQLAARRSLLTADGDHEHAVMIEEADCPALRQAALLFEDLPAATLTTPGLPVYQTALFPPPPPPHGPTNWVWGPARLPDGGFIDTVQSTGPGPSTLHAAINQIEDLILPCIHAARP